ncbi:unnamed protein product [Ostreobium quekettii]|uniref:Uncharacterized protein n=1 Tax=Ostreobium quekettii TaxID=121088 RepID=A0A8S1JE56_9CHLO|nr:unnamed protein product [Ostreobium quekettii]
MLCMLIRVNESLVALWSSAVLLSAFFVLLCTTCNMQVYIMDRWITVDLFKRFPLKIRYQAQNFRPRLQALSACILVANTATCLAIHSTFDQYLGLCFVQSTFKCCSIPCSDLLLPSATPSTGSTLLDITLFLAVRMQL